MLLELKGFILLKVFPSDVQSVFPFDIALICLPLNENYKVFPSNHPFFIYSVTIIKKIHTCSTNLWHQMMYLALMADQTEIKQNFL